MVIQTYLLVGYFAAAVLSSDLAREVQVGHFHSSPTHRDLLHLKKNVICGKSTAPPSSLKTLTTDADRVPASCCHMAHGHPPEGLHYPGLLLRGQASVPQLTMAVKHTHTHTHDQDRRFSFLLCVQTVVGCTCPVPRCARLRRR